MKNCIWLKPELVAQIEFAEWTPDNHLRHSKFIGLREDKEAREVLRDKVMTKNHQAVGFLDRSITDGDIE